MRPLLLAALSVLPSMAMSSPAVYICKNAADLENSVLQPEFAFAYDADAGTVSVSDPLIIRETGGPVQATVPSDNATRLVFTWTLRNVTNSEGQTSSLAYRVTYFKADGRFSISMRPLGYDNSFNEGGTCKLEQ
jgi:hypothetical protein